MSSLEDNSGNALVGVMMLIVITLGFIEYGNRAISFISKNSMASSQRTRASLEAYSAIETTLMAYRYGEHKYVAAVKEIQDQGAGCEVSNPFLLALKEGAGPGCNLNVTVWDSSSNGQDAGSTPDPDVPLYTYPDAGCTITSSSSTCGEAGVFPMLQIEMATGELDRMAVYHVSITSVQPARQIVEMRARVEENDQVGSFSFGLKRSLNNQAHLENNGRMIQTNPNPLANCDGSPWDTYYMYIDTEYATGCVPFAQLGGGDGVAFYKGRYFGVRSANGQVIDFRGATELGNYLVNEDGTVNGEPRFPPYNKLALVNVNDITLIGNQIYYVTGTAGNTKLGVLDGANRTTLCDMAALGWAQTANGIAALSSSDTLLGPGSDDRIATFFLTTSGGALLTAVVTYDGQNFECGVFRDPNAQAVEYLRTQNGFDRTEDERPYFVF